MNPGNAILLHASFLGFSLVVLSLLLFVPFYRTLVGWILFFVHLNFWLILFLAVLIYQGVDRDGQIAEAIRNVLYPFTTLTAFSLFGVVLRAQIAGRKERLLESELFNKKTVDVE